jgi:uncharacterized membrane protein
MDQISGLPAHPLLVHIPVAMLPLAAFGVIILLARKAWYERYRWAVLFVGGVGTIGAILAASSGEGLEKQMRAKEGAEALREIHDHVEAGDLARALAIVFFVVLALYVVGPWYLDRRNAQAAAAGRPERDAPRWMRPVLMVAVAITAVASMVTIINAGHSGASRAWEEYNTSSQVVGN